MSNEDLPRHFVDFCWETIPGQLCDFKALISAGFGVQLTVGIKRMRQHQPTDRQWDGAHSIARSFSMNPGKTRWISEGKDNNGTYSGYFVFSKD